MVQDLCKHGIKKLQMNFSFRIHGQFRKELLKQTALNVFFRYSHQWLSSSTLEGVLVCLPNSLIRLFETINVRI
ncbi:hypothetical protein ANAPC2_01417 [Anaplasma phagocytophilum]|nr:hypothetical protein ANAPC2_01417 [Anaplasma phagocytophilum]